MDNKEQEELEQIPAMQRFLDKPFVLLVLGSILFAVGAFYPAYSEHKTDHEALLDALRDIMNEVEDDGEFDQRRLSIDLDRWFSDHFRIHDAKLHSHTGHH